MSFKIKIPKIKKRLRYAPPQKQHKNKKAYSRKKQIDKSEH
jgi:hypothetical protein